MSSPAPVDETVDVARQLAYLEMDETDWERLQAMAPALTAGNAEFVEAFYRHLFRFEESARFLQDPALVERLKVAQQSHLESMLQAVWNEEYVERRRRVGDAHAQVGIHPRMFLGAYNQYLQFCFRRLLDNDDARMQEFVESGLSLMKAVFFDIGLTLDAYFQHATENLQQALEMVYHANAELRQFAQLTSHDLKTPLGTMANLCDEALDEFGEQMPAGARELIDAAKNRAYRMSQTIDELLNSALTSQSGENGEVFSSELVINQAADTVRPLLEKKQIELVVSGPLPWVCGDAVKVREAFYNLLSNAAKFIDKRPGRIQISARLEGEDCIFCVADNGPGIPPEELRRIFVPFRRLPRHRNEPGSGLGLYFTKSIIEQQSGQIWVESEVGQGSRFFILLKTDIGTGASL
ncbi:MAG TPA: protoglobin domain-containing protein [Pirellulales bacterium]|nr:protoglobin domain-containing protein [Pirellulales bacterium]